MAMCRVKANTGRHKDEESAETRFVLLIPGRAMHLDAFSLIDRDMWHQGFKIAAAGAYCTALHCGLQQHL